MIAADLSHRWRCGQAHIPNLWSVAGLALILKPGKPGTQPAHYRPIGLIDALGKAAIAMLFRKIRHDLETYVLASPQFAYVRGRSTQEALRRVFYHCHQARTLRAQNSRNLHAKRAGFRSTPLTGGIQVCLDMSTAFDVMPRADLQEALWEAGVPESPARLLLHWIDSSVYRIRINHLTTDIRSSRGVKQGCPVSPLLFAAHSTMITRRIDARLQEPWTAQHATLYADDWHLSSLFHSRQQFDCICQRIGVVLAILSRHGMLVNAAKTAVILTIQGAQRRQVLGEFTRYLQEQRHLKVQVSGQAIYLPMVRQAEYLGAIISYNNFRSLTLEHRLGKCKATHSRLRKVLQGRRGLALRHRVLLWQSTVLPSALYGLGSCGLNGQQIQRLHQVLLKQLRAIARAPSHLTHESDEALLERLSVLGPAATLLSLHEKALSTRDDLDGFLQGPSHPWTTLLHEAWRCVGGPSQHETPPAEEHTDPWTHADRTPHCTRDQSRPSVCTMSVKDDRSIEDRPLTSAIQAHTPTPPPTLDVPSQPPGTEHQCPHCPKKYRLLSTLRWHMTKVHKLRMPIISFDRAVHSVHGMPTCAMCGESFTRWEVLEAHVIHQRCSDILPSLPSESMPTPQVVPYDNAQPESEPNPPYPSHTVPMTDARSAQVGERTYTGRILSSTPLTREDSAVTHRTAEPTEIAAPPLAVPSVMPPPPHSGSQADPVRHLSLSPATQVGPMEFHSKAVQILSEGGVKKLLRSPLLLSLTQHCLFCWHAAAHTIKIHVRHIHPDLFALSAQATKLATRLGGSFSPCLYCERPHAHPRQHLANCIPLWQACLLALSHQYGSAGGRTDSAGNVRPAPRKAQHPDRGCGQDESIGAPQQDGQAERRREGARPQPATQSTLSGCWQKRPAASGTVAGGQQGGTQTGDPSLDSSAGGHRHSSLKHGMDMVATYPRTISHPRSHQGRRVLARAGGTEGQQAQGHTAPSGHVLEPLGVPRHGDRGYDGGSHQASPGVRMDGRTRQLGFSALEWGTQSSRDGRPPQSHHTGGASEHHQGDPEADPSRHLVTISHPPKTGAGNGGADGEGHDGRGLQMPGGYETLPATHHSPGQCIPPGGRPSIPAGDFATTPGTQTANGDRVWLRTLILNNPSNYCYFNAAVRSLLWAQSSTRDTAQDVASETGFTNAGLQAIAFLRRLPSRPHFLPGMLLWRFVLAGWARAQHQHDCAEFLHHIASRLCPQALTGDWSARRLEEDGRPVQTDSGTCDQAVALPLPAGDQLHAQNLIHHWHTQSSVHALRLPPRLMILQFPRYSHGPEGARKNHANITWPRTLHFPLFVSEGLESRNITYTVEAAILHAGNSITEGHYTALLLDAGDVHFCDDGVTPRLLPPHSCYHAGQNLHSREVYLLICRRGAAPHH